MLETRLAPTITYYQDGLQRNAASYLNRIVSPLTGIDKSLAFSLQDEASPRIHILMAQLTAVHRLLKLDSPFSYHIGGYGVHPEETFMRALGESLERYSHMVYPIDVNRKIEYGTVKEMSARYEHVLQLEDMQFYTKEQYERPYGFPYRPAHEDTVLGWIETIDVSSGKPWWIPAQLVVVGYIPRHDLGEPWLSAAVTTGTAAHTDPAKAMRSAALELVQVDTTMGYWYSDKVAREIILDERTPTIQKILRRDAPRHAIDIRFYYLENPDMKQVHVVAAVIWNNRDEVPTCGIGVSAELDLELAMYKAYLEAAAIPHLSLMAFVDMPGFTSPDKVDAHSIYNLDNNVMYYAYPENRQFIEEKFSSKEQVKASELPLDKAGEPEDELRTVLAEFARAGKRLALMDLTSPDVADLNFYVFRFYSPDTLGLCLPSAPQLGHRRYKAYGGATHERPHPYP